MRALFLENAPPELERSAASLGLAVTRVRDVAHDRAALARARGIRADAARVLGIDRGTLARRLRAPRVGR
jgi:transcriptional regulator of acetoin/glycerol metabolism